MKKSVQPKVHISVPAQELTLKVGRQRLASYPVSTSKFGLGSQEGSMKTPTGRFRIAEKIGAKMPVATVFKSRQPVTIAKEELAAEDLIMTRILWLDGLDPGNANTRERFIYIHGTRHEDNIGRPDSHGCIRMRNADVIELFELVDEGTPVVIEE